MPTCRRQVLTLYCLFSCVVSAVSALLWKSYGLHSGINMHMMSHLSGLSTWCLVFRVWNNDYNFQLKPCHRLCHRCDLCTYDSFFSRRNSICTILDRIALILKRDGFFWCSCFSFSKSSTFMWLIWKLTLVSSLLYRVFSSITLYSHCVLSFNWRRVFASPMCWNYHFACLHKLSDDSWLHLPLNV